MGLYDHIRTLPRLDGVSPWNHLRDLAMQRAQGPKALRIEVPHLTPAEKAQMTLWKDHLQINRQHIFTTAEAFLRNWRDKGNTHKPSALILGVGPGLDMDLGHLARHFDLTIVDYQISAFWEVINNIPPLQRRPVKSIHTDITGGVVDKLFQEGIPAIQNGSVLQSILENAARSVKTKKPIFPFEIKPNFVLSSMVVSQLFMFPFNFLESAAEGQFVSLKEKDDFEKRKSSWLVKNGVAARLHGKLIAHHIRQLTEWVHTGAWVYLASDVFSQQQHPHFAHPMIYAADSSPLIRLEQTLPVDPVVQQHLIEPWKWQLDPNCLSTVNALVLTPQLGYALPMGGSSVFGGIGLIP